VNLRNSFPGFQLRLTRWGAAFLMAVLVLGVSAVNTGNNALMAALGLALGAYVVSGTWSRQVLGCCSAHVRPPRDVFADRPVFLELELANSSRLFPAYGLVLRDGEGRAVVLEPLLPAGGRRAHAVARLFPRRGWTSLGPWRLEVLLPLGFFLKSKQLLVGQRLLVYPKLLERSSVGANGRGGRLESERLDGRGREGDVTHLREFQDGDERRQIHWKQSARQQRPIVTERERPVEAPVFLVVDPRVRQPADPVSRARFEHLLSEVATGVVERLGQGKAVGLVVGPLVVGPFSSPHQAPLLLAPLAEVELQSLAGPAPATVRGGVVLRVEDDDAPGPQAAGRGRTEGYQ
jgi:uncharacterized protein (DUF58 family)